MKKLLLFSLVFCIGLALVSQNAAPDKNRLAKVDQVSRVTDDATNFENQVNMMRSSAAVAPSETVVGITWYDLFSNFNTGDRFYAFEDGTLAAVWIFGLEASAFPDRGTGYNYYNGTEWGPQPTVRVESVKTGWPNIAAWGPGGEIGIAHLGGGAGLQLIQRETKGSGTWTESNFVGPPDGITWPRLTCSGENNEYTHVLVCTNGEWQGQATTVVYSRSDDGGVTWNPQNVVPELMGPDYYLEITQDKYFLASNGNVVCMLYVDAYSDLFYLKSEDNGDPWAKQVVWNHPVPFYTSSDPLDSCFVPDFSGQLAVDNNGHVHVAFGITRYLSDAGGSGFFAYNPANDGIVYWNDMMETLNADFENLNALAPPAYGFSETELVEDVNYVGWMQDIDGDGVVTLNPITDDNVIRTYGMSTQPTIHVDDYGQVFIVYSAFAETYLYTGGTGDPVNYRHLFGRAYANGSWGEFMHLSEDISHLFDDCVYPMLGNNSNDYIHYIYQADNAPGNALDGPQDYQENRWVYAMLPKSDLIGVGENEVIRHTHVSQNYPNPVSATTMISVNLEEAANLSMVITNMTGQKVMELSKGFVPARNHVFTVDASTLPAGIYFYTVKANNSIVTKKMIVE